MLLLPAPRFHIMTPEEIRKSMLRVNAERRISDLKSRLRQIEFDLRCAEDHRDWMHKVGIYAPSFPVPQWMKEDFYYGSHESK